MTKHNKKIYQNNFIPFLSLSQFPVDFRSQSSFFLNRSFWHNCIRAEKNSAKNLPVTGVEPPNMSLNRIISTGIFSELRFEFRNHVIYSRFFFQIK